MASNPRITSLAGRLVDPNTHQARSGRVDDDEDEDALFAELEAEIENDDNSYMREQGLEVFKRELENMKDMQNNEHGRYSEITEEKEVVRVSAREPRCVIHFYHSKFKRCEIMDKHLAKIAPKYFNTRFSRVFVENVPWLVEKLGIKVLPCVICFIDGIARDRLIGFEELGNNDAFDSTVLEIRLATSGVIQKAKSSDLEKIYKVSSRTSGGDEDDDVFDLN